MKKLTEFMLVTLKIENFCVEHVGTDSFVKSSVLSHPHNAFLNVLFQ